MEIEIGELYLANLGPIIGHEQSNICPVYILKYCDNNKTIVCILQHKTIISLGELQVISVDKLLRKIN